MLEVGFAKQIKILPSEVSIKCIGLYSKLYVLKTSLLWIKRGVF
jgi:hypothetical protein